MDIKQLLEKMEEFAGEKVGQKPGDQWKGTDKGTPGKKLVGDSILKDLSKGKKDKSKEQELSEEFQAFLEAEFKDTVDKRPARKSDRHPRGHEPQPRYKTVKTDESAMGDKDIELQDYRSMSHKEFQTAYGMTKTEWINKNQSLVVTNPSIRKGLGLDEAGNPAQQAAIAIAIKKAGKKPKNEGVAYKTANPHPASRDPIVAKVLKQMRPGLTGLDMNNEAFLYFAYEIGKMRAREMWVDYGPAIKHFYQSGIGVNEDANTDNKLAKLLTRFVNQSEGADRAVALDAIEYIKKLGHIEQFATSLDYFGVDLDEGWESGPEEYEEPYDDADDAYDRQRQAKLDAETEAEWAKLPKVSTYQCIGRGANMEPNQKFGPEFDTLEKALEYRAEIMKDPKTPHPEHIGINTLTRVVDKESTDEGVDTFNRAGYNPLRDKNDYLEKLNGLIELGKQQGQNKQMQDQIQQRILDLRTAAIAKGFIQAESRGHTVIANKLKDVERAKKFALGKLKVPTPQERQAQLKQLEKAKSVKEFVAPPQGTATQTMQQKTQAQDPKQAQAIAQATNTLKAATGSTAPTTNIAKALDSASQGNPVGGQDMKALEPLMKDVATIAQTPQLAGQLKTVLGQVQQVQQKQKQQQQQTT